MSYTVSPRSVVAMEKIGEQRTLQMLVVANVTDRRTLNSIR